MIIHMLTFVECSDGDTGFITFSLLLYMFGIELGAKKQKATAEMLEPCGHFHHNLNEQQMQFWRESGHSTVQIT